MTHIPTLSEAVAKAKREKRAYIGPVLRANDQIHHMRIGPRGGKETYSILARHAAENMIRKEIR